MFSIRLFRKFVLTFLLYFITVSKAIAADAILGEKFDILLATSNNFINKTLYYEVLGIPLIVLILSMGAIFFTLRFGFINIRYFKHAFHILLGKYDKDHHEGAISHLQAFAAALSSTVGLGTVAGVAVAVSMGGPGAIPWMMIAGFFGMSLKFAEVTLAFRYRTQDYNKIYSGPFQYIRYGLEELGFKNLGIVLAALYAGFLIFAGLAGSTAFQSNQMMAILSQYSSFVSENRWIFSLVIAVLIGIVVIGGIERVAKVASSMVPAMSIIYVVSCIIIVIYHIDNLGNAIHLMFSHMFDVKSIVTGGTTGAFVVGIRRALFASEAGMGTAAITHSGTKDEEPVRAGFVAMIEPCFDTMLICCLTGLIIVITGVYENLGDLNGILITQKAFSTISSWFPVFLVIAAPLFAFSSVIVFIHCCEIGWLYLFNDKSLIIYRILVLVTAFFSGISNNIISITNVGDAFFICSAIINITTLILLRGKIHNEIKRYISKFKSNDL